MNDNDKTIAKEILLHMVDKKLGEFECSSRESIQAMTTDAIGKAYKNILKYVANQE